MGDLIEDDFEEPLLDTVKKKYPALYKMINKENVYLTWKNSTFDAKARIEEVSIVSSTSYDYIGKLSFKIKIYFNEHKKCLSNCVVASSVIFDA